MKVLTTNETVLASAIHCMFYFVHWINDLDFIVPKNWTFYNTVHRDVTRAPGQIIFENSTFDENNQG